MRRGFVFNGFLFFLGGFGFKFVFSNQFFCWSRVSFLCERILFLFQKQWLYFNKTQAGQKETAAFTWVCLVCKQNQTATVHRTDRREPYATYKYVQYMTFLTLLVDWHDGVPHTTRHLPSRRHGPYCAQDLAATPKLLVYIYISVMFERFNKQYFTRKWVKKNVHEATTARNTRRAWGLLL